MSTFDKDTSQSPGFVNSVSDKANYVSNKIHSANEKIQDKISEFEDFSEKLGVPQGFLAKENTNRGMSSAVEMLLKTIDRTAQRTYIGVGFSDYERKYPNVRKVITQTPEAIVLIKKRLFSSISDNYNADYMDERENHFLKASKKLFENKCSQISNYERITKLNQIMLDTGMLTTPIANSIYELINDMEGTDFNSSGTAALTFFDKKSKDYLQTHADGIKRIRDALTLNGFNQTTTWIGNTKNTKQELHGYGTGVIELTLVTNLTTKVSNSLNEGGSCSFTVSDPCRLFFIDEFDIEKALYQTSYTKFSIIDITANALEADTEDMKQELNAMRMARGASTLTYKIDVTTKIYNKVNIILDRIGFELTKSDGSGLNYEGLESNPNVPSYEAFTSQEQKLLNKIYKNLFKIQQVRMKDFVDFLGYNKDVNYTRKLMRLNYLGRELIQPMDTVTIFIDSQTIDDKLISMGLSETFADITGALQQGDTRFLANTMGTVAGTFGSTNFLGLLNQNVSELQKLGSNPSSGYDEDTALKNILAGKDFPYWLWDNLRSNFTSGNFGTCVFCGLIERISESYSDGSYTLSVSAKDNSAYFEQGWINTKPALDQFNGHLYDPLTPFDFEFDAATGQLPDVSQYKLLSENRKLLQAGKVTVPDGKHAGEIATLKNFGDPDVAPSPAVNALGETFDNIRNRIYTTTDGFVYRWKRGIGTAIISQSGISDGVMSSKTVSSDIALVVQENPFGGQDLANAVSILVCGEPYNFNTFFQASKQWGTISLNSSFNPDTDFFQGLFKRVKNQNKIWGNFIPFKKITADPTTFSKSVAIQALTYAHSAAIKKNQDEKARLLNQLMQFEGDSQSFDLSQFQVPLTGQPPPTICTAHPSITIPIIKRILELDAEIQLHSEIISQSLQQNQNNTMGTVIAVGDNVYYNSNDAAQTMSDITTANKLLVADQNELTKRRLWQVKANTDQNLFIVGSEYDQDYDIQKVSQNLMNNFDFINTNWQTIRQKISEISIDVLGMEMFANTQGHIELRTPKYNRMPSSVLFEMLRRKKEYNIQVYPSFLEKAFKNQLEAIYEEIETIEDNIRLRCIALGCKADDASMESFLSGSSKANGGFFAFTTDSSGNLTSIRTATEQINKDYENASKESSAWYNPIETTTELQEFFDRNKGTDAFSFINTFKNQALQRKSKFDVAKQIENYNSIIKKFSKNLSLITQQESSANTIRTRLHKKLNKPINSIPTIDQLLPNSTQSGKLSPIDVNAVQNEIQSFVVRRHEALNTAVNLIKNLDSAARINSPDNDVLSKLLLPNLYGTENVPEFLRDLIEDENRDDFGVGSGKRFVIHEKDIISMQYQEENPEFTMIEVTGSELGGLVGSQGFDVGNNMHLSKVYAVDYDLWRMYGFKQMQQKHLPFLNNAETQLAPFALFCLNKERARILSGSVTIRGNEFIQPGEVYYIKERGLLFYSRSVSHNFTYGGNFTTTIELTYGHVPGEYIPTPFDVIGKSLFRGEHFNVGNYRIARSGTIGKTIGTNLGAIVFPNTTALGVSTTTISPGEELFANTTWGNRNKNVIEDIKGKIIFLASKTLPQTNSMTEGITVRVYSENAELITATQTIISELKKVIPGSKIIGGIDKNGPNSYTTEAPMIVAPGEITNRNPSSQAWALTKEILKTGWPNGSFGNDDVTKFLSEHIIDIWLEESIPSNEQLTKAIQKSNASPISLENTQTQSSAGNNTLKSNLLYNMYTNYDKLKKSNLMDNTIVKIKIVAG